MKLLIGAAIAALAASQAIAGVTVTF